jgi:hypothetical protein
MIDETLRANCSETRFPTNEIWIGKHRTNYNLVQAQSDPIVPDKK